MGFLVRERIAEGTRRHGTGRNGRESLASYFVLFVY